ncbi:putative tail protein [Caulobacter phage CcrPW]|uniref:receptor protein-tyrosine kinase n=1 Tax=Caulobacter phage CcrPW TaxID=2283271 RepID=A0A385ECU4_9CAUD|nr:putative tail protein [Caulobacter phage CcrPW]AXQ68637.1 putative tail protein [Caulobacter phage CcrPW]
MSDLLLNTPVSVGYTGAAETYIVKAAGIVQVHMWGGAGAGGYYSGGSGNANRYGGSGGYATVRFMAEEDDILTLEVGQGGQVATGSGSTATNGGNGGWPDGGYGGKSSANPGIGFGGGGGSSRLYKNGELVAVAGAGGGATGFYYGGNGGGVNGLSTLEASAGAGGTQTAGGATGTGVAAMAGGYFSGGKGSAAQGTAAGTAGSGAGGGYYGGGSNSVATNGAHGSGGGGSGYINATALVYHGYLRNGPLNTGQPFDVPGIRAAGVAEGGNGPTAASSWGSITPGGNGQIYMTLTDPVDLAGAFPLTGTTTYSYTGSRQALIVDQLSSVDFEMWGGGGGGGFYSPSGGVAGTKGGAGGYTKFTRILYPGDFVEIEVAQGGQNPSGVSQTGGAGGWPNGGDGGRCTNGTPNFGGGGGSSNIYINGRLVAVASGGGGGTGFYHGGNGGGRYGLTDAGAAASGSGGTWGGVAAGLNRGYYLMGGHGSPIESTTIANASSGAGGGGGYYGGGGARGGANTHGAGGGGCGYINGDNTYNRDMQAGVAQSGNPYNTANRPAGVGVGGNNGSSNATSTPGGDGAVVVTVSAITPDPLPEDKTALSFTGAPVHYIASNYGAMLVKAWAGGGAGSVRASGTPPRGGGGGFARIDTVKIKPGDIITFVVAEGGKCMPGGTLGGRGGFPNGEGGNAADATGGSGGGGGSSHVYINGKLILVAGGGGGGSISFTGVSGGQPSYPGSGNNFETHGSSLNQGGWAPQRGAEGNNRPTYMLGGMGQIDGNPTIDTPNNLCGGGGGGGYFGGAGSVPLNSRYYGGNAGTTYIHPDYIGAMIVATATGSNTSDPDWVTGVSVSGVGSSTSGGTTNNGGHGRIVFDFDILPTLDESAITAVPVLSTVQTYVAGNDGDLVLDAWGGGGGGSVVPTGGGERGGGGGYATGTVTVKKGQIVKFYNGRGGGGGNYTSGASGAMVGSGGLGGWPDGGNGGFANVCISGAGGGSSRIYVDDVLMMVAGGGGGVSFGSTTTTPGGGGGTLGGNSDTGGGLNNGGSQSLGGRNSNRTTDTVTSGNLFKGGHGYISGGAINTHSISSGGGGGGGFFGGAGSGGPNNSAYLGGAGGSGFIADGYGVTPDDPYRMQVGLQVSFDTGSFIDDGRTGEPTLLDTAPTLTATGVKYGTACGNFPGTGHVTYNVPAIGTQDFTLEGWFNPTSLATGVMMILGNNSIGGLSLHYYPSATVLGLRYNNTAGDGSADYKYTDTTRAAGVWAHYAICRDVNGTRVYKDGQLVTNVTGVAITNMTATTLTLANYNAGTGASTRFNGKIDEVRLTVGVARYKQNFKPAQFLNKYSQIPTLASLTQGTNGVTGQPAGTGVTGYQSGRGVGGQAKQALSSGNNGGDGQINYFMQTSTVAASGPIGTITVSPITDVVAGATYDLPIPGQKIIESYNGARTNYLANAPGVTRLLVEMWGAGGGGCSANNSLTTNGGGGAGYTSYEFDLNQGDRITVQTPSGGGGAVDANGSNPGGAGGYPNGGKGYRPATTTFNGGGGGSAQLWVRGALAAVAGGGGGGSYGSVSSDYRGGAGGGASGENAFNDANGGGTQTTGGFGSGNGLSGSFLQGGRGGTTEGVAGNGSGGGGGYYGGGGGGPGFGGSGGGAGSGYVNTTIVGFRVGSTTSGSGNQPAGKSSPNYVSPIGVGSNGKGGSQLHGGNGRIVITNITPTPAATSGDLGPDITVTPITTLGFQIGLPVSKPIATVTVEPPVGYYGFPGFPTMQPFDHPITMLPVESNPTSNALVIVPINDSVSIPLSPPLIAPFFVPGEGTGDLGPDITITAPDGSVPNSATGDLGTAVTLTAPEATTEVIPPVETSGDIGTITIEPLLGEGSINYNGYAGGDIGTVTLTSPEGSADPGSPHVIVDMPPAMLVTPPAALLSVPSTASGDLGPDIVLTAPDAFTGIEGNPQAVAFSPIQVLTPLVSVNASTGDDVQVFTDPGLIYVRPPLADGLEITEDNYIDGLPSPLVLTFSAPEGSARGDVEAGDFLPTITVSAPEPFVEVAAEVVGYTGDFIILTLPPQPVYDSAANLSVAMPPAVVINGADGDPSFDITLPLPGPITLSNPEGAAQGGYGAQLPPPIVITQPEVAIFGNASGSPGTVQVIPPVSFVETPAFATGGLLSITLSPPVGNALGGVAAGASGSLPTISLVSPEGGNVAEAAVNANLPSIFLNAPVPLPQASVNIAGPSNTINVLAPAGTARVSTSTSGDVGVITVVAPEGIGYLYEEGFASGDVGTITVTPPASAVTAAADKDAALPTVIVTPPDALPIVPGAPSGDVGTIVVTSPEGMGFPDTVTGTGDIGTVVVTTVDGTGMVPAAVAGTMPAAFVVTPPEISRVNVSGNIGQITLTAPTASLTGEVNLSRPINVTISLTAPDGLGYPVIPGDAEGDLGPAIYVTASDGSAHGDYNMIVPLSTIPVSAPESTATGDAEAVQQGELPIVVSPPAGEYYREASVILGLSTIYIFAPNATVDADDKTAAVTPELPVIYVEGVDGFAEVPVVDGTARIQFRRSMTPGAVPASLETREIAFNEVDGIMYSRDGSGSLRPTPWGTLRRESIPATIGAAGQTYRADGAWAAPQPVYDLFVQGVPASGVRVALGETFVGKSTRTPESGLPYYSPFFVPRTVDIASLSVDIQAADMGVAQVAIWTMDTDRVLGQALVSAFVPTTASGVQTAASTSVVLQPGWYAASLIYIGLGAPVFNVMEGPAQIATDFTTQQGTPAFVLANLQ